MRDTSHLGMTYAEYLASLKPGDKVTYVLHGRYSSSVQTITVERLTATQIVTKNGRHYRIKDGMLIGGRYEYMPVPASEEEIQKVRDEEARSLLAMKVSRTDWDKLPMATLEAVIALLPKDAT